MALSLVEPTEPPTRPNLPIGESYEHILNQSIQNLMAEISKETPNFSHFINVFYELMQSRIDPPLETIWVYSALSFRGRKITSEDLSSRISIVKELFRLISGCSGPCSASKSIALLAPVVFQVYKLVAAELLGKDLGGKKVKKVIKEVKSLIGVMLGYISACCCKDLSEESDLNLIVPFMDLVSVWLDGEEDLKSFLPFVNDEICKEVSVGEFRVHFLAGVVIAEAFLLKLCMDLCFGNRGVELEKDMRSWVVGSITGFQSFYFFETLVRMLMEPTLPVTSLLSSEDESLLKTILYDAAVLVEYSFLSPERTIQLPAELVRSMAMKRLILTQEAIQFFRKDGDQKRAISYTSSFSSSCLPSQIIKFVKSQIGMTEEAGGLNQSSPKALIRWLLMLASKGQRLFDDGISKHLAKLALEDSRADHEQPARKQDSKKADVDLLLYFDYKGEEEGENKNDKETNESMISDFLAAAHAMRLTGKGGRKRKEGRRTGKKKRIKLPGHESSDNSDSDTERSSSVSNAGSSIDSEDENPVSDDDV